jgi:hypothetical protein
MVGEVALTGITKEITGIDPSYAIGVVQISDDGN